MLFLLAVLATAVRAEPLPSLLLGADSPAVDAWPAVSLLHDPEGRLSVDEAIAARERFVAPRSAYAALGLKQKVVWLRIPVTVAMGAPEEWVLDVDYTLLNRIDVFQIADGRVSHRAELGNAQPFASRPLASRSHAASIVFMPGQPCELLLRVDTAGSMILPITLFTPSAFVARALGEQMLQGLLASLGFCLLLYSLLQWLSLRERLYLKYALLIAASVLFSVHFFGIGELYLWTDNDWLERHMAGLTSLTAAFATALFIEDVLRPDMLPWLRTATRGLALLLALAGVLHALDIIDIHVVSIVMSTLGLMPALMGAPGAIARLRRGDSVGAYFLAAWLGYFIASAVMVGVVRGTMGANFWTMHSFQFGATIDMLIFMRIAVLRTNAIHVAAQRATRERDTLISLAHSDPLTGLMNRRGLNGMLAAALPDSAPDRILAVYMLDLDRFKPVNDQFGHDVGDELLMVVAKRLRATVRTGDVVARVGGDEFVVMAAGLHHEHQARELGAKILDVFQTPFAVGAHTCSVGATIGFVLAPADGTEPVALLKAADAAMYAGKQAGKNCLRRAAHAIPACVTPAALGA